MKNKPCNDYRTLFINEKMDIFRKIREIFNKHRLYILPPEFSLKIQIKIPSKFCLQLHHYFTPIYIASGVL